MSEITTKSVESHKKMRAVHAITPVVDNENVILLAPDFKLRDFCQSIMMVITISSQIGHRAKIPIGQKSI